MPFFNAPATVDLLTANGDTTKLGYVTVTSNANYYPGAICWLRSNTQAGQKFQVVAISGTTLVGLRALYDAGDFQHRGPSYGLTSLSAFLLADSAQISQEPSTVYVENSAIQKVNK